MVQILTQQILQMFIKLFFFYKKYIVFKNTTKKRVDQNDGPFINYNVNN